MSELHKLTSGSPRGSGLSEQESSLYSGWFSRAPETINNQALVVIPLLSEKHHHGPCRWEPRVDASGAVVLPRRGDECVVAATNDNDLWVVSWWTLEESLAPPGSSISQAELDAAIATRQAAAEKNTANGYAGLGADATLPTSLIPALATTEVYTVASQAAQLALVAQRGDVAVRTDQHKSYIHNGGSAATMGDWTVLDTPIDAVTAVNGQIGTVNLAASDVGAQPVDSDLTAIAALATTSFGRSLLTQADAAAARSALGVSFGAARVSGIVSVLNNNQPVLDLTSVINQSAGVTVDLAANRLIADSAGWYSIGVSGRWPSNSTGIRFLELDINGGSTSLSEHAPTVPSFGRSQVISGERYFAAGDYLSGTAFQNSGSTLSLPFDMWLVGR